MTTYDLGDIIWINFKKWSQSGYINKKGICKTYTRIKIKNKWTPFILIKKEKGYK
jgi:hypothetical protein